MLRVWNYIPLAHGGSNPPSPQNKRMVFRPTERVDTIMKRKGFVKDAKGYFRAFTYVVFDGTNYGVGHFIGGHMTAPVVCDESELWDVVKYFDRI
mgnify:FL=1